MASVVYYLHDGLIFPVDVSIAAVPSTGTSLDTKQLEPLIVTRRISVGHIRSVLGVGSGMFSKEYVC